LSFLSFFEGGFGQMSKEVLKMKIEELSSELDKMIATKNFDLLDDEIIDYSHRLDILIVNYINK